MTRFSKSRRDFIKKVSLGAASLALAKTPAGCVDVGPAFKEQTLRRPNVVLLLADQWRAQATGYSGDPNAVTPALDALAKESVNLTNAVSGCPVCCPYRASLITGQYPLTHGVFLNDVPLKPTAVSIAEVYKSAGYDTAYIGKWHLDGHGRSSFIPEHRRQGFEYWKAMECTHDYNNSYYYADDSIRLKWEGYDAVAQTQDACRYITDHAQDKPFLLLLSWGPPHSPYHTAPQKYRDLFKDRKLSLRPNVPTDRKERAQRDLAGYYAHIAALDDCVKKIVQTLKRCGLEKDTILVFTSDHGDMLGSQGERKKQRPWDESIKVPFLLRYPAVLPNKARTIDMPFNTPDIMPTLLGLSSIEVPRTVEGGDFSDVIKGASRGQNEAVLIMCPAPFGQWQRRKHGGREYRGIRTRRYTYVRDLTGPWLLYDNVEDPCQLKNLCNNSAKAELQRELDNMLTQKLEQTKDEFLPAQQYIRKWSYTVDETGTVPYTH